MTKRKSKVLPPGRQRTLDAIIDNPELTPTQAVLKDRPEISHGYAQQLAWHSLNDDRALSYLKKHSESAQKRIVKIMNQTKKDDLALRAAQDILDRVHGKAIQRNENLNQNVTVVLSNYNAPINKTPEPIEAEIIEEVATQDAICFGTEEGDSYFETEE